MDFKPGYESFARNLVYLNIGLHVVPYGSNNHPSVTGYSRPENTMRTLDDFEKTDHNWRFGYGVVLLLSNLVMVDVDMHDPDRENGKVSWERICQYYGDGGTFPPTWMCTTPRGGIHLFYKRPANFPRAYKSTGFFAPGVELKVNN